MMNTWTQMRCLRSKTVRCEVLRQTVPPLGQRPRNVYAERIVDPGYAIDDVEWSCSVRVTPRAAPRVARRLCLCRVQVYVIRTPVMGESKPF